MNLEETLARARLEVDGALERLLPAPQGPAARVAAAMRHACLGGGKRLRPALVIASCEACGGSARDVIYPAAAVELIHTYSLIHDDLPAMDDDDLRRGRPTVHRAFDEASAILAGDALLTLGLEILADCPPAAPRERRLAAVVVVTRAAGHAGMIGGQMADLEAQGRTATAPDLDWIHRHKTGALLGAAAELGALHAGADAAVREAFAEYGRTLGLAFQIADDILDCTSTAERLGKTPGKDESAGKLTYPALHGLDTSRSLAEDHARKALEPLRAVQRLDATLEQFAAFAVARGH